MFITCNNCNERVLVVVNSWRIIPEKSPIDLNDGLPDGIEMGRFMELNFDSDIRFRIKPIPNVYRCIHCGYEKSYTSDEIRFR